MAMTEREKLKARTIAARTKRDEANAITEAAKRKELSSTLDTRSTLSNVAKDALSTSQLQNLSDRTTNQRLTSSLTPDQLAGKVGIEPTSAGIVGGDTIPTQTNELSNAIVDNYKPTVSEDISAGFSQQSTALVQALKQRIAESQVAQQNLITKAPQAYDPLRAQSEVAKSQQLRSTLEQSANLGDRGGVGRQEALLTQTEGENRLSDINLQQQNFVDQANAEIQRLGNEGRYQEAEILATSKANELEALLNERVRQEGIETAATEQARRDFISTAGQFANDYKAQINKVLGDNDPNNDWQADILGTLREEKLQSQGLDQQGQAIEQPTTFTVPQALEATRQGLWNEAIAKALGLPFTEQGRLQVSGGGGTGGGVPNVAPVVDTGLAGEITGKIDLENLLSQPVVGESDKDTGIVSSFKKLDTVGKIRQIKANYAAYIKQFGEAAVEAVVGELGDAFDAENTPAVEEVIEPVVEEPLKVTDYKTSPDFAEDIASIQREPFASMESYRTELNNNSAAFINKYGYQGYQELVKLIQDRIDNQR